MKLLNKIFKHALISTFVIAMSFGCMIDGEKDDDDGIDGGPITELELTEVNSFTQRIWFMAVAEAKYISATGAVDSTYTEVPDRQELRFSKGSPTNPNLRVYSIYDNSGVIGRFWPGLGDWQLSSDGFTLSILQNATFPEPGKSGGAYTVSYNPNASLPFPYPKALGLKHTRNLAGGRKIEVRFILGSN